MLGRPKVPNPVPRFFFCKRRALSPKGPGTGRTPCGPSWAAALEARLALLLRSALSPSEREFWTRSGAPQDAGYS